jgi:hypothetical protein
VVVVAIQHLAISCSSAASGLAKNVDGIESEYPGKVPQLCIGKGPVLDLPLPYFGDTHFACRQVPGADHSKRARRAWAGIHAQFRHLVEKHDRLARPEQCK